MQLSCPTADRLREFLEGSVDDPEANQISGHVVECPSCDRVLVTLESEQNDVLKTLRDGVRTESLLQEPEFEQLRNTAPFSQADTTAPADVEEHFETGKRLRDYRLVKKIGEGGMGTVYQAVHVHLAKHVALKILPADKLQSGQSVKRFRQEMRAVGQVNHPNVVSASDAGTIDGQHFLVMELVQGADLARIIHERGPLNVADACEIVRQAAIGLQHAHDTGLVHRDVKPSNIMLALDGSVKLLDLGLAGLNNTEFESTANVVVTDRLTSVGQIMGTLDYMAPEQIKASPEVDGKADIYALGATLFQLLTGRTPCGDRSEGTPERIEAVLHKPPLEIAQLRSDVPEELRALLLKMLAKKPEDRPESAIDVASELKHSGSDADLVALAEECRTSLDMPSADVDVTDDVSFVVSRNIQPQGEGNSRRPFTAVALASFFLALVAAVVYYIQTDNGIVRIEVTDPSLKVAINGQTITMTEGNKKPLTICAGEQSLVVRQGDSDFEFETDRFQIRRGDKIAFKVERLNGEVVISRNGERFGGAELPNDHQEIQGVWQVVSARQDDVVNVGIDVLLTVEGHAYTLSSRGPTGAIVDERTGKIEVDGTKTPKRIDFFDSKENGEDLIGIYKLEGDILTICVGEVHERKRPRDFKWPQGPGIMRMECQRRQKEGGMDIHTSGVREAALRTSSHNNMKHITFALLDYYKAKQQWPDQLDALLPFLEVGKSVFENPLTGDNPGYDYVKPTAPLEKITAAETIVLYQLRDGQRDRQLYCAYLDGQVRLITSSRAIEMAMNSNYCRDHEKSACFNCHVQRKHLEKPAELKPNYLTDLDELDLSFYPLTVSHVVTGLRRAVNLRSLNVNATSLRSVAGLSELQNLRELDLSNNELTSVLRLGKLKHLKELSLYKNQLTSTEGLEHLENLEKLNLVGNRLTTVKGLENLLSLKDLVLYGNQLRSIKGLENLRNLEKLDLQANRLTTLQGLERLEKITWLHLGNNNLDSLDVLHNLKQLTSLYVGGNRRLTKLEIDKLRTALPNCNIYLTSLPSNAEVTAGKDLVARGAIMPETIGQTDLLEIKEQNKHQVHIQELDCPLPASWQYRIYIPKEKSAPLFRLVTGVCEDSAFADDKLSVTASVPVPLAREQFVLNITIRRASDGEYKCYAYIVGPKNADFHEIALPAVENLKLLTDPREKYFETGKRVMASGTRHQEVKLYQPGAAIPLVLFKTDEKSAGEDSAKAAESFPAIWLRLKMPAAPKDSSTAIHGDQQKTLPESPETDNLSGVIYWEPDGPKRIVATAQEKIESRKLIKSAWQSEKDGDVKAATDAYLKVLSLDPSYGRSSVVELFQEANRLVELGECIDETGLKRSIYEPSLTRDTIRILLSDTKTRDLGLRVLRNYFRIYHRGRYSVLTSSEDFGIVWKDVPDLIYFLRVLLIPTDFEKEGAGWGRYSVLRIGDREEGSGPLSNASVLFCDKDVLRTFKNEVHVLTTENPGWKGGLVLLASLEAELGNFDKSVAIINEHFIGPKEPVIPVSTAWVLGLALEGKSQDLDQIVIRLYEYSMRKIMLKFDEFRGIDPLRFSPLNELARLYAKYGRKKEARQLLYGLVDASDQHPLVQGYTPSVFNNCNYGPSPSCVDCHRTEMNLPDYVMMSDVMTDIGYPVDSLISLARIDASFGNAFTSSDGWVEQKSLVRLTKEAKTPTVRYRRYSLPLQKRRAEQAVTPRSVIDALELGTFETKHRYSQRTYDRRRSRRDFRDPLDLIVWSRTLKLEETPSDAIDLMLSVRGEGPDAKATVFSPVIDVLKLAAEFEGPNAAKEIADLDARLRLLSEVDSNDVQAAVASTVFAFLREDLETAQKRLEVLKDLKLSSKNNAQRANATLWLAARYALQYEKTRAVGAVLAERAIAAAGALRGTRLQEAIVRERSGLGLSTILELRPDPREKLARKAEELGNKWLAERLRSDPKEDDGEDVLGLANRLAKEEQWDSGCDAFLEAFRLDPNLFGAYVDGWFLTGTQINCFAKAGRLADLARFFDATTLKRMDDKNYGLDDLVRRLFDHASTPETRSAGYELIKRVFQHKEYTAEILLRHNRNPNMRIWKQDAQDRIFLLRCWLIPRDIENPGWVPFAVSVNEDKGSYSNRATEARPLLSDPGALRQFADEVRELLKKHPKWIDGWALLALLEGEIGNYSEAAQLVRSHILTEDPATISVSSLWTLGDFLNGKDQELNGIAVSLWELAVRKCAAEPSRNTLRVSPINTLARAYAEDNRGREARRLLFGLVDPINQHPLVKGYVRPPIGTSIGQKSSCNLGNQCITCHRNDGETIRETEFAGFYDVIKMSDAMTDIGYPVDTLVELARADASLRNRFSSSRSGGGKYGEQASKARAAVTPRKVIEALETDAFYRSSLRDAASVAEAVAMIRNAAGDDEKTKAIRELARASQQQQNKKKAPIDLMLSVRGEGPDAQATVFSPVVDILKLAVESKESNAAKDITELDKRLVELSEQHPKSIEAGIAATMFAFLRDDVDAAKNRLKKLLAMRSAGPTDPQASDFGFWLAAPYALADDRTKALGEQLAERAIAAAEKLSDPRWRKAIHGDHQKSLKESPATSTELSDKQQLRKTLERSPQLRDKLAQQAEELGNSELAEWIRSDLPADEVKDGKDAFAKAARLAEDEDWNAACDAFLEAFRSNPNLFGAYVDGKFLTRTQIGCFEKAGRLTDLARFFNVTTLQRRRAFQSYGMNDLVIRLTEDRSPETRSAGYELLERVFQYRESVADSLLRGYSYERFWKSVPDPVFLLRCWLIPKDIEKRGWAPFNPAAIHEDEGSFSNRLTRARPLLVDPKAMRQFADEVREQLEIQPKWIGGWALLALLEGEIGNYREAAQLVSNHILKGDPATIPTPVFWTLGDFSYGKDPELNGIAVKLWELTVRKYATNPEAGNLRVSPINTLARAYAEDNRDQEARQLLYGLVDPINQHPLVKGYAGNKLRCNLGTPSQCITCHRNDEGTIEETDFGGFYDVIKMSEAMTDIGYPVDALLELARKDATFRNAFSSSRGWVDTSSEKGKYFEGRLSNRKFSIAFEFDEQISKARAAVTPRKVIEALETDAFYRSSLHDEAIVSEALSLIRNAAGGDEKTKALRELARTSQERENKGSFALDLMLSVRGEGPDAQATVFSPVIDIFKLAAESKEPDAAKDIAVLDKRLVTLSEQHPKSIETRIAATVFAFLRNDLDSAKDRLKQLQSITNYPESDGAAFWLVARHALKYDETRILGAVLAERALTAAETQPNSRLKEAILRERSGIRTK